MHDVGGSDEAEKYIKKYDISEGVKEYSKSLPSYKKIILWIIYSTIYLYFF